jgi:hypothetical protein
MSAPADITVSSPTVQTVHSLPASNPAGTSDTVALPVQGVTGGVPLPVSAGTLPLPAGAAQDGTDATGVVPPAGAGGIRGWLSGIYIKLASSISVTGTFWQPTQPVSAASLPLPAGAATAANQPTSAAQGSTTSGQTGSLMQGAVTAASPSYTTAQTSPLSLDTAGNLRVNVVAGGGGASGNVAQGSATSGQTGGLMQGAVTAVAPAYVTAQTSPISLTPAGAVRTDASATTQPISAASLPLPAGAATAAGVAAINTTLGTPMQATGGTVTANAGTNLNTSALALETGGNLAQIKTNTAITPAGTTASSGQGIQGMTGGIPVPVAGTFFQTTQPVSAASLPLPSGAATAAGVAAINTTLGTPMQATGGTVGIAAGTNAIGSIIGRTTMATATPAVTSNGAYAAGNEIGGLMSFAIGGAGSGTLMSLRVTSSSVLTTALKAYIFSAIPSNTTWTDKTAPAINAADIASLLAVLPLNAPDNGLGTHTLWELSGIAAQFVAANLYVVLVTVSAATLTSGTTSDITVQLGVSDD